MVYHVLYFMIILSNIIIENIEVDMYEEDLSSQKSKGVMKDAATARTK
jgi:hypothetical protein